MWGKMAGVGFNINVNYNAVIYDVFLEKLPRLYHEFYEIIMCTVVTRIWKMGCAEVLPQGK